MPPVAGSVPRILLLGGIDPCGGAGLTADTRMVQARGGMPMAVPTCLTVQSRRGLRRLQALEPTLLREMLGAVLEDGPVHAVKVGLLGDLATAAEVVRAVGSLAGEGVPLVVDPVLSVSAGGWTAGADLVSVYREQLAPDVAVLTPNLPEVAALTGSGGTAELLRLGCGAVLVKGGHGEGDVVEDRLFSPGREVVVRHPRLPAGEVHGTGCALAAAVAVGLARGQDVEPACRAAIAAVVDGLRATPAGSAALAEPLIIL